MTRRTPARALPLTAVVVALAVVIAVPATAAPGGGGASDARGADVHETSGTTGGAHPGHRDVGPPGNVPEPHKELRGTYVVSWRQMISPESIDQVVAEAADNGINALFVQVRARGDAYYDSDLVPRAQELADAEPDFDPLAHVLEAAHAEGIEVHAWLNATVIWGDLENDPVDPDHVVNAHPEWLMRDAEGRVAIPRPDTDPPNSVVEGPYFISPGHPDAADHLVDVYMEVLDRYDVDGLHFDFIRYPARMGADTPSVDHNPVVLERFTAETGAEPVAHTEAWATWHAEQLTDLVRRVRKGATARAPKVEVSASVLAAWDLGLGRTHQDWRAWMADELLDFVVPMSYADNPARVWKDTSDALQVTDPSRVVVGLGPYLVPDEPEVMATQIDVLRREGVRGFVLFAHDDVGMQPSPGEYLADLAALSWRRDATIPTIHPQPDVPKVWTTRNPLTVRVGEIDRWTREFAFAFFSRNGETTLRIDNRGLRDADIELIPAEGDPIPIDVTLRGTRTVVVDLSEHLDPFTNPAAANHTYTLSVTVPGSGKGGRATFLVEDRWAD